MSSTRRRSLVVFELLDQRNHGLDAVTNDGVVRATTCTFCDDGDDHSRGSRFLLLTIQVPLLSFPIVSFQLLRIDFGEVFKSCRTDKMLHVITAVTLICTLLPTWVAAFHNQAKLQVQIVGRSRFQNPSQSASLTKSRCILGPLFASSDEEENTNYDKEETLMSLYFSINENVNKDEALTRVTRYCQSFPFAAVLPVQPLQYLPTDDGGVDVRFLRKKTKEKGSLDGGIRFFVSPDRDGVAVVAKRNSVGQTVPKMFSEKLVVQSFIKRVTGDELEKTSPPPTDVVTLVSAFHKWMD